MEALETIKLVGWDEYISEQTQAQATDWLEQGKVLYLPELRFAILPEENHLLSPRFASGKAKNISFDINSDRLRGALGSVEDRGMLKALLSRFATQAACLAGKLFPSYQPALRVGRTSFRPVEIKGRMSSYQKDDTRLHIDAFPSTPVQGNRILRVFSNINPNREEDRVWHLGASFEEVAKAFLPKARRPFPAEPGVLRVLGITKSRRTAYDHYMLQMHDRMKADLEYQAAAVQLEFRFPGGSTWIVFTDQVSHAAISGQHALEQTLYLPIEVMADSSRSPVRILERLSGSRLV